MNGECLNQRLAALLDQSVEEYIKTAVPIASGAMCTRLCNNDRQRARSPATIRNDLKILEELGYLHQVHAASVGRIPTRRAYAQYMQTESPSFVSELINDLAQLSYLINRIERKLGSGASLRGGEEAGVRKINFQKLFEEPELQMSAIYLIIKEKIDNGKIENGTI